MGSKREGLTMEIFPFLCLFIGIIHCDNVHPNHPECWLQCGLKDIIATITCTKQGEEDSATTECECQNNAKPEMTCSDFKGHEPFNHLQNWIECQELAQHGNTVDDWHNTYFRWENKSAELKTICYFLETCADDESLLPPNCVPYEGAPCVAGVTDSCDPDPEHSCPPATWSDDGLHWTCNRHGASISAYGSENLPGETQCFTTECKYWEWSDGQHEGEKKEAKVKCVKSGKWETRAETGKWESFDLDGRYLKSIDPAQNIFPDQNDAPCHCGRLQTIPANLENPGLNLFCEKPLAEDNGIEYIEYGNTCTLLCDGHFVMYIECYLGAWQNTAKYPFEIIDDDGEQIKC